MLKQKDSPAAEDGQNLFYGVGTRKNCREAVLLSVFADQPCVSTHGLRNLPRLERRPSRSGKVKG